MAATFRSQFRHPPRNDDAASQNQWKPPSRIPTKSNHSNTETQQSKATRHAFGVARSASRSITPSGKPDHGTTRTEMVATPVTSAHNLSTASKRTLVAPSEANSAGESTVSTYRSDHAMTLHPALRTPSLASVSPTSRLNSPRTNGLRRKPSTIENYAAAQRAENAKLKPDNTTMQRIHDGSTGGYEHSVLDVSLPQTSSYVHNGASVAANQGYRQTPDFYPAATKETTPSVPNYARSATPSTRYTDSPFSHVPTPSSTSSYSPTLVTTSRPTTGLSQTSPVSSRKPVVGRSNGSSEPNRSGLPLVRGSSNSSSNATLKSSASKIAAPRRELSCKSATAPPESKYADTQRRPSRGRLTKERPKPKSSSTKPPVHIPPELAHLNVDPPNLNKALPPVRPSREGTPNLTGLNDPSPVVQSDLPKLYTTYHKRTPSQESNNPASPSKSKFGLSPKISPKQTFPRVDSAISPSLSARTFSSGPTPDATSPEARKPTREDTPAVAASPSKSPRFGFFSRKSKSDCSETAEKPKRQPRKGPAAGTGHEGYGRFGIRGRSGSTTSSNGVRSPSQDSSTSSLPGRPSKDRQSSVTSKDGSEIDEFLRDRLTPVVLRGNGGTFNNATSSSDVRAGSIAESTTSSVDNYTRPHILPSAMSSSEGSIYSNRYVPSESSEDDVVSRYPASAVQPPPNRLPKHDTMSSAVMPAPFKASRTSKDSSIESCNAETLPWQQVNSSAPAEDSFHGKEGFWLRPLRQETDVKPPRKWNFFQRAHASPGIQGKYSSKATGEVTDSVTNQSPDRGLAHYVMLDPVEPVGLEEVERIMQENPTSSEDSMSDSNGPPKIVPYEGRHASLLPRPPKLKYSESSEFKARPNLAPTTLRQGDLRAPKVQSPQHVQQPAQGVDFDRSGVISQPDAGPDFNAHSQLRTPQPEREFHTPETRQGSFKPSDQPQESPPRQSRLSPVGRIPKVVSRRDQDRKLSETSFSRPFARAQPRPAVKPPGSLYSQIRGLASPIESGSQPVSSTSTRSGYASAEHSGNVTTNPPSVSTNRTSLDTHANHEFFSFSPRKGSDNSQSSGSGYTSRMAAQPPQQEDVWTEYNDLLDEVMPQKTPLSACSSQGAPFQYSDAASDPNNPTPPQRLGAWNQPSSSHAPAPTSSQPVPSVLSVSQQIARFMQPSMSPLTTPNQLAEFINHYDSRSTSTLIHDSTMTPPQRSSLTQSPKPGMPGNNTSQTVRTSLPSARHSASSSRLSRGSGHSRSASLPDANVRNSQSSMPPSGRFNRSTQILDIDQLEGNDPAAAANLRFGALMTSKWLSFGRVLFSPAHNEVRLADDPKVLIIDGLGSDWSYYVALSYPSATVYNLGPPRPNGTSYWPGVNQKPPPNHRHINHASMSTPFPFEKGTFTAVVFRFPIVSAEEPYHACISQCKRVLRPGGYLEMAVLDLDLMNMGNRARKSVRGLKTRIQEQDQNVSLRNLSDILVRFIGRRGFGEIQRCVVGVPAAGRIPTSQDLSSVSSDASGKPIWLREEQSDRDFSFADVLEDARASQADSGTNNDENITKMVAKVGRWWYSTCYEKALLSSDSHSIWNDPSLLRECRRQGTAFRLLICHAQKPAQTCRRTVSV